MEARKLTIAAHFNLLRDMTFNLLERPDGYFTIKTRLVASNNSAPYQKRPY
jgi:hypothetical protein